MKKALIPFITVLILTNTTTYCQETKPWSTKEKIEALSKFWAEARRNFVYMPQIGVQRWDSLYRENIQIALDSKTDWDFYCQMKRFCGFLQNGHTSIQADGIPWTTTAFRGMELQTMYADGKIIVSGIDSLNSLRIPLGSEIVEIEGEPAIEYMKKNIVPLQAASTPHIQMRWAASSLFQGLHHTKHNIVIQTLEGKRIPLTLENYYLPYNNGRTFTLPGLKWTQNTKPFDFRMLDKKIAYVKIGTFQNESVVDSFENNFDKISKAKGIIIDLRSNGGGSDHNAENIIKHLTSKSKFKGMAIRIRAYEPHRAAYGLGWFGDGALTPPDTVGSDWNRLNYLYAQDLAMTPWDFQEVTLEADRPYVEVPTIVLTNNFTASAAEDFLIFASQLDNFITMGETTFGSTGQPITMNLCRRMRARICTIECAFYDLSSFEGVGIEPDIAIPVTVKDLLGTKDVQLEAAVKEMKRRLKANK